MRGYQWKDSLGIEPGRSYTDYNFRALLCVPKVVDDMRKAMVDFSDDFRTTVSSGCLNSKISVRYETSTLVFMDGYISADGTGFGVYVPVGYRMYEDEPSSVFTAEISTLLNALLFINSSKPSEYLILSDSLSSIGALRSKRISARTQFKVHLMWIPAHVGVPGNEMLGGIAEDGAKKTLLSPWGATFTRRLNLAFCSNGKADGTKEIWVYMPFQSLLVCSATLVPWIGGGQSIH
jgi:hypothetical protein